MANEQSPGGVILLLPTEVEIPASVRDLPKFRSWSASDAFPREGRLDFLAGTVEVDMAPEDVTSHATVKVAIVRALGSLLEDTDRGFMVTDRTRYVAPGAALSCEPDVMAIQFSSLLEGRVRLVPKSGAEGRFAEVEGSADLVVEVVSDSSEAKDRRRLFERYREAGVGEYWLVDARGPQVRLEVFHLRGGAYVPTVTDPGGHVASDLLGVRLRIARLPHATGVIRYRVETEPTS